MISRSIEPILTADLEAERTAIFAQVRRVTVERVCTDAALPI